MSMKYATIISGLIEELPDAFPASPGDPVVRTTYATKAELLRVVRLLLDERHTSHAVTGEDVDRALAVYYGQMSPVAKYLGEGPDDEEAADYRAGMREVLEDFAARRSAPAGTGLRVAKFKVLLNELVIAARDCPADVDSKYDAVVSAFAADPGEGTTPAGRGPSSADMDALLRFAGRALADSRIDEIGDWDGGDVQETLEECGLIERVERTVPCGEGCRCTEYVMTGEVSECYPITELGQRAVAAYRAAQDAERSEATALPSPPTAEDHNG